MSKQFRIRVSGEGTTVGEIYNEMVKAVDNFGTEAEVKLHVGLNFITITPCSQGA